MACLVSAESFLKKVTKFQWGIKTFSTDEESQQGRGARSPAQPAEGVHTSRSPSDVIIGPGVRITIMIIVVTKSFQGWCGNQTCKGSRPDSHPSAGHGRSSHGSIPHPSSPGLWSLVETRNCRNSTSPPPKKTTIVHCILYEPASGLPTLLSFLPTPHPFSSWQQIHKKWKPQKTSPWETQKTKTGLATQVSWLWPAQEWLRLVLRLPLPLRSTVWTVEQVQKGTSLSPIDVTRPHGSRCGRWFRRRARALAVKAGSPALPLWRGEKAGYWLPRGFAFHSWNLSGPCTGFTLPGLNFAVSHAKTEGKEL